MKPMIYCKTTSKGAHNFYLLVDGQEHYLFQQAYRKSVHDFFHKGVLMDAVYDFSKAHHNNAIIHTLQKLPPYIKYIESEYEIVVLKQTQRKRQSSRECEKLSA